MFIRKGIGIKGIIGFTGGHLVWLTLWVLFITSIYSFTGWKWLSIPWLPISVIATAVAFYVGFKNNQAYDRLWEARKIWGAIVNSSRVWGSISRSYVNTQFTDQEISEDELKQIQKSLIYRHIAWLYTLRSMLLVPTSWEHISQNKHIAKHAKKNMLKYGIGSIKNEEIKDLIKNLLPHDEIHYLKNKKNPATQLIDIQSQQLDALRRKGLIDDFRHVEMQKALNDFYIFQGKCERIKKFPLPRQYGSMSFIFVGIFIFLLPFGMVSEFSKLGEWGIWLSIPSSILVGWVYLVMELVGDYSENPFEGLANDIPMLSLCRTIEIDLREMLQETDIPKPIEVKNGVLM